jgi:DNA-binding protein HU-beta
MNKQELIELIAENAGVTKKLAGDILDAAIAGITQGLKNGQTVTVTGFGTFRVSARKARSGVNPRDPKQRIQIPALRVPAFRAGKTLKDAVR